MLNKKFYKSTQPAHIIVVPIYVMSANYYF